MGQRRFVFDPDPKGNELFLFPRYAKCGVDFRPSNPNVFNSNHKIQYLKASVLFVE